MDMANLDLKAASERGSWVPLTYQGEILGGKKPVRINIRGMGSDAVMQAFRKVERVEALRRDRLARATDASADSVLAKSQTDLEAAMAEMVVAAVMGWENVEYNKKTLECTPENVLMICGPGTLFFGQVTDAIREAQRLFTSADSAL